MRAYGRHGPMLHQLLPESTAMLSDPTLTVPAVSKRLKLHPNTIYKLLGSGKLRGSMIGKQWRVSEDDLHAYMHPLNGNTVVGHTSTIVHDPGIPPTLNGVPVMKIPSLADCDETIRLPAIHDCGKHSYRERINRGPMLNRRFVRRPRIERWCADCGVWFSVCALREVTDDSVDSGRPGVV